MSNRLLPRANAAVALSNNSLNNPVVVTQDPYRTTLYGETRVGVPFTLADNIHKYDLNSLEFDTRTAGGGTVTHVPLQSAVNMAVTGAAGDEATLRTVQFYRYQAGKGMRIKMSAFHADLGQTNQRRLWGFFDDNDGLFFQLDGTQLSFARRTSTSGVPVDNVVPQSDWNNDKFDGSGPSGVTLNLLLGNIYEFDLQWLSAGRIRIFINGFLAHVENLSNIIAGPYMRTAQLPLSWSIVNDGASTGSSFTEICSSVVIEGGGTLPAFSFNAFNPTDKSVPFAPGAPIVSIRPKLTFNGIENRMLVIPQLLSASVEGSRAGVLVLLNAALTGPVWTSVSAVSGVESDVTATLATGGEAVFRTMLQANTAREFDLSLFFKQFGRNLRVGAFATGQDTLTIVGNDEVAGTTDMRASLIWNEVR